MEKRPASFYWLAGLFTLFVLFLYGPMITILILSFQGPEGGLTFPMNGVSLHWFAKLWEGLGVVDIWAAFRRSFRLGLVVMALTVVLSLLAGLAYRKRFRGSNVLFYVVIASLIVPSIVVSLGIGLEFRLLDDAIKAVAETFDWTWITENYTTAMDIYTSGLGAQLTWTLPFGLLNHLRHLQPVRPPLRGGRAGPGRDAVAELRPCGAADHRGERDRDRAVRLYAVLGRSRALQPGHGRPQHAAARARGAHDHRDQSADLCAGHGDDGGVVRGHFRRAWADPGAAALIHMAKM